MYILFVPRVFMIQERNTTQIFFGHIEKHPIIDTLVLINIFSNKDTNEKEHD